MKVTTWSTIASIQASRATGTSPGGPSATTPQPWSAKALRWSVLPSAGLTTESGTTRIRRPRPSPRIGDHLPQLGHLQLLVVVEQVLADADHANPRRVLGEHDQQDLGEQPRSRAHRVVLVERLVGPATPLVAGRRQLDAHRRAAVDADNDNAIALLQVGPDLRGQGGGQPLAVRSEGAGVVLLAHGPEAAGAPERQLGARHLADHGAALAQHPDHRRPDARAAGALVDLGVGVEQAVRQVADRPHAATSTILPTWRRSSMYACAAAVSLSGNVRSTGTVILPSSAISSASRISSGVATRKPRIRWPCRNSSMMSSGTTSPACAPQVTSRPSGAIAARCSPNRGPPVVSTTASTPRPPVAAATASATGVSR